MKTCSYRTVARLVALGLGLVLGAGCAVLRPENSVATLSLYALDGAAAAIHRKRSASGALSSTAPTLLVGSPRAAAGFDSKRIIYLRQPHRLEYFASGEWVDTPARMLAPLIVSALESRGYFHAVVHPPGSASGDLRLETQVIQLQHEFVGTPSRVRFVLRASLIDEGSRLVVATHDFAALADATSDDPYAGVVAANQAVAKVLDGLADFCSDRADLWARGQASMR